MSYVLRNAEMGDTAALERLIAASVRGLCGQDYSEAQIEAALGTAWGVDTELIGDGTYFVVENSGRIIACGGWSRRGTRFGGDRQAGRQSDLLVPGRDAARIRAFFVHPGYARQGIGRRLLQKCEAEAKAQGFRAAELVATRSGEQLYRACGYAGEGYAEYALGNGLCIEFLPMSKAFA